MTSEFRGLGECRKTKFNEKIFSENTMRNTSLNIKRAIVVCGLVITSLPAFAQLGSEWPNTDPSKTSIDISEIMSGGPPKDGIPSIDKPEFIDQASAEEWLDPREPVVSVAIDGQARAYPLQILMWHEIVNDEISGVPVSVTFCPLCNASIAFDRRLNGEVFDFGTTGRLRKSDMVMYDRQTESWWQQFTGEAIVGELVGKTLNRVPAQVVAFETFRENYPEGQVLSKETGHRRNYGANPYRGYDSIDDQPFLFSDPVDPRLPVMEYVLNVSYDDQHKLYPLSVLEEVPVVNDEFADRSIVIFSKEGMLSALDAAAIADSKTIQQAAAYERTVDGKSLTFEVKDGAIVDTETGSRWGLNGQAIEGELKGKKLPDTEGGVHFAFAWLAFRPDSVIFEK